MRLYVVVEGKTEREFVTQVLGPHLYAHNVYPSPIIVTTNRDPITGEKRGQGGGRWHHWLKDLRRVLGEHTGADVSFTTLFDLYGLPDDFPQLAVLSQNADTLKRVVELEQAMFATVNDHRLIPYIQLKTLHGPLAIAATGLMNIRAVCPRFDAWLTKLEGLSVGNAS